jgi:hypothetical protein
VNKTIAQPFLSSTNNKETTKTTAFEAAKRKEGRDGSLCFPSTQPSDRQTVGGKKRKGKKKTEK